MFLFYEDAGYICQKVCKKLNSNSMGEDEEGGTNTEIDNFGFSLVVYEKIVVNINVELDEIK